MSVQIIREGWLTKEGGRRHNWKKRWFTLGDTKQLTYYETANKKNHKGTIDLTNSKLIPNHKKQKHGFGIICPDRTWYLGAVDNAEREVWLSTLEEILPRASVRKSMQSSKNNLDLSFSNRELALSNQELSLNLGMFEEVKENPAGPGFAPAGPGFAPAGPGFAADGPGFAADGPGSAPPQPGHGSSPLPPGWEMLKDTSGRIFYANHLTKSTQWTRPVASVPQTQYIAPPVVAAAPPRPVERKPSRKFPLRVVAGQKVRILKRYNKVPARTIGQVSLIKPSGSIVVDFGRNREVGFTQEEIPEWLEPWGGSAILSNASILEKQPLEVAFNEGRLGLEFKLSRETFIVTKVIRNYEAHTKGVMAGMRMVSAFDGCGNSVSGPTAPELAKNLSKAPRPVRITFVPEAQTSAYI
jgi:hypothetical protein